MSAQRGEILRAILRPRFDELSARKILSERLSHRHLMRLSSEDSSDETSDRDLMRPQRGGFHGCDDLQRVPL